MDQEHLINILSDGFNQIIGSCHPVVANTLARIKDGYEEMINSIAENLSL
jgi:hypothetical protein